MRKTLKSNVKNIVKESVNRQISPLEQVKRKKLQFSNISLIQQNISCLCFV